MTTTSPYRDARLPLYRCEGHPKYVASCEACKAAHSAWDRKRDRLIGYGQGPSLRDALPTQRRLAALMAIGWPLSWLGQEVGVSQQSMSDLMWQRKKVSREMEDRVRRVFDRLQSTEPVGRTSGERMSITNTRNRAKRRGYAPPAAWDDETLEDPEAQPQIGDDDTVVDRVLIERVIAGKASPKELSKAERLAAVAILASRGVGAGTASRLLRMNGARVNALYREVAA